MRKRHKYSSTRVFEDGIMFDSKWEHKRYRELKLLQKAGDIFDLETHPQYSVVWPKNGARICTVILDFRYVDAQGDIRVEDTKGMRTAISNLKRKLVEAAHGIKVDVIVGRV